MSRAATTGGVAACLTALGLAACASPAFYFQAASGHLELMRARQPVSEYLQRATGDDPLAERLAQTGEMLEFAERELGLPAGDSYRSIVITGRDAVAWNVLAAPEFSVQPKRYCHLVAGCVSYRGYFDQAAAEREAARLRRKGLDVAVSPVRAYSSLGWFDDPLLDTLLALPDAWLAGTLFHELSHQRLYVRGDTEFNEAYASYVEREAVRAWLTARGELQALQDWQQRSQVARQFNRLLRDTRRELARVYASDLPPGRMRDEKQQIFTNLRHRHDQLAATHWPGGHGFSHWFESPPNNARLALAVSYLGGQCAFARLFEQAQGDFDQFHRLAEERAGLPRAAREDWLGQDCPP